MTTKILCTALFGCFLLMGCSESVKQAQSNVDEAQSSASTSLEVGKDYHSFSNPEQVKISNLGLDLTVDFAEKILTGSVDVDFVRVMPNADKIVLDTRDLTITKVTANGHDLAYELAAQDSFLGAALTIVLPEEGNTFKIEYHTSPDASGVQWLTPAQTEGKKQPFLFTQSQAIHARSFIPLQDSPQVRVTYQATIRTSPDLLAVMSAANDPNTPRDGVYEFAMPQPIPSYLIALAVGDLHFKAMGERTGVYVEPAILDAAAAEFADTESMLNATEKTFGPYSWDRYDLLILPPSFPLAAWKIHYFRLSPLRLLLGIRASCH